MTAGNNWRIMDHPDKLLTADLEVLVRRKQWDFPIGSDWWFMFNDPWVWPEKGYVLFRLLEDNWPVNERQDGTLNNVRYKQFILSSFNVWCTFSYYLKKVQFIDRIIKLMWFVPHNTIPNRGVENMFNI